MAEKNPTGDGASIALTIPPDDLRFLCSTFTMARDGIREELAQFGDRLQGPHRLLGQLAAYGRLLAALGNLSIVPDRETRELVAHIAGVIDAANEYSRVVAEHKALHGFLDQIATSPGGA